MSTATDDIPPGAVLAARELYGVDPLVGWKCVWVNAAGDLLPFTIEGRHIRKLISFEYKVNEWVEKPALVGGPLTVFTQLGAAQGFCEMMGLAFQPGTQCQAIFECLYIPEPMDDPWMPWVAIAAVNVLVIRWPNQYPIAAGQKPEQRERYASVGELPPCAAAARAVRLGRRLAPETGPPGD